MNLHHSKSKLFNRDFIFQKILANNFHIMEALKWDSEAKTDIYIINLKTGEVTTMETEPIYSLHHANAYQIEVIKVKTEISILFFHL